MAYQNASLILDENKIDLPLTNGSDGSQSVDISGLYGTHGISTFDPHLRNTCSTESTITWIDSEKGILLYRGYDVAELVEKSSFVETAYLLGNGHLPTEAEYKDWSVSFSRHSMIHESMRNFFDSFPGDAHPLAILSVMVTSLSSYYPATYEENFAMGIDIKTRLLAKVRTLAAWSYKKSVGQPIMYPRDGMPYCVNFLNMMFSVPAEEYHVPVEHDKVLNKMLILYSDHEQNVATSTVRLVGSTQANLFACCSAGMCALWGARESGANVPPLRMLHKMASNSLAPEEYFDKFVRGQEAMRTTALGHSSYRVMDPRAGIAKKIFHEFLKKHPEYQNDPIIQKALEVETFVLGHPFFKEKRLYPNLDYYSSLIFHMLGIPAEMSNVVRVIGKISGWLAHWQEQRDSREDNTSYRPRQVYRGEMLRSYEPLEARK